MKHKIKTIIYYISGSTVIAVLPDIFIDWSCFNMVKLIESTHSLGDIDEIQGDLSWCDKYAYDLTDSVKYLEKYLLNGNRKSDDLDAFLLEHAQEIDEITTKLHDITEDFNDLSFDLQCFIDGIR